jgi:5'-nucleotidase
VAFPLAEAAALEIRARTVEVVLLSETADTGLGFNSSSTTILALRVRPTGGESPTHVPRSTRISFVGDPSVRKALDAGRRRTILPSNVGQNVESTEELRIAFDGDAVIFSDEAERIYKREGLDAFTASEITAAKEPLSGGPFKSFLAALHRIQSEYPADRAPIRTALVTARSAPAHERVVRTLRAWNIRIDEALFLGGLDKGPFLKALARTFFRRPARALRVGEPACRNRARAARRRQRAGKPEMRILKYTPFAIAGIVVLVVLAAVIFIATLMPTGKPELAAVVKDRTGRTLAIEGNIVLTIFPSIGAAVGKTSLSERGSSRIFARFEEVRVSLALIPLFSRQVVVDRVTLSD